MCLCVLEYVCDLCVFLCWPQCVCVSLCMHALEFLSVLRLSNIYQYPSIFKIFLAVPWDMWNLSFPQAETEPVPPALKRKVLADGQPRKPSQIVAYWAFATKA